MCMVRSFLIVAVLGTIIFDSYSYAQVTTCEVPEEADLEDVSTPDHVIGNGTPQSCTSQAFVQAVAQGGVITFNCGPDPLTITLTQTAKIFNDTGPEIVIDGNNMITLSGGGTQRILYMNTCDQNQVWTTSHCQNQDHPRLTVQNLTFIDGNSEGLDPDGGGAIWVRGGRFKIVHCRFMRNRCDETGPDVGGAAVRVFSQYETLPVYVVESVFGGAEGEGNICSNGGGLSSIGVSFTVINSLFSHNEAIGNGGNPAQPGTPGGGSGAAIYNDGNEFHLNLCGAAIHDNRANQHGGSIFFVSNNNTGTLSLEHSGLWNNQTPSWLTHTGGISYRSYNHNPSFADCYRSDNEIVPKNVTIDVDGDEKIGMAEVIHALETISFEQIPDISVYARKRGDVDYNHRLDLIDVIIGLKIIAGEDTSN